MDFSIRKMLIGLGYGLLFGFLSPVPGISTGTLAILLNIYDKMFANLNYSAIKRNLPKIITLGVGCAVGLIGISNVMVFLFENYAMLVSFAFLGLVAGCMPAIYRKAVERKLGVRHSVIFLIAFGIMVMLAIFGGELADNRTIAEMGEVTPGLLLWLFFAGFISSMSMLVPGVGGSLMMIVFGIYNVYLESIATFNIPILGTFVVSMLLGLAVGAIITKVLLQRYFRTFYSAIGGFIAGSLIFLFPGVVLNWQMPVAIALAALGCWFAYRLSKVQAT
jgi:putative membrane protein